MSEIDYKQQRRNRKKQFYRILLGVRQLIYKPVLNITLIPVIVGTIYIWVKRSSILSFFDVPELLLPIYRYTALILGILLPIISLFAVIETIGNLTARKDEADLQESFKEQEQRNGFPLLMDKKVIKGSNVTMREFYTEIPMKIWLERQEEIADLMNVHFVEKLKYGGKSHGRRIVMFTAQGRENTSRGDLYDDEY